MKLFVVNCSNQDRQVYYRIDFAIDGNGNRIDGRHLPPKFVPIAAGQQVQFGPDFQPVDVDNVIQQLEEGAGAVSMDMVKTAKAKGVVKLVWSLDKPVPRPICEDVKAHNMGRLTEIGADRRRRLAINADYGLRQIAENIDGGGEHSGLVMEVQTAGLEDPEYTAPPIEEGIKIMDKGDMPRRGRPRRAA